MKNTDLQKMRNWLKRNEVEYQETKAKNDFGSRTFIKIAGHIITYFENGNPSGVKTEGLYGSDSARSHREILNLIK